MKGKPLLPTLRTKKRYVAYEVISEKELEHNMINEAIKNSFKECFGIFGLGKAGLMDTKIYSAKRGVLKINHKYVDDLRASMGMITKIGDSDVIIQTIGVSGILAKTKARYMS